MLDQCHGKRLTHFRQIGRGLSIHAWPSGHAVDMEETIAFSKLEDIDCMVQTFPLEKANEAFGKCLCDFFPIIIDD